MKISTLRKIYPYLSDNIKNHKWRKLTDIELDKLMAEKQVISNCYDVAVRYSLLGSEKGRDLLKNSIHISKNSNNIKACKITFNIDGKKKIYKSTADGKKTLGDLIAKTVGYMIKCNPLQKPIISRLARFGFNKPYEFNKPSNAFSWYTGKKAISFGENNLHLSLRNKRKEVLDLFNQLAESNPKDYSFVAISSWQHNKFNGKRKFHCLPVLSVNKENQTLKIINKRTDEVITVGFNDFINKFKAIVGIKHK